MTVHGRDDFTKEIEKQLNWNFNTTEKGICAGFTEAMSKNIFPKLACVNQLVNKTGIFYWIYQQLKVLWMVKYYQATLEDYG